MGRWVVTLALLVGCFVLAEQLPFSPYFRYMDTLIHEFGHAAATLLLSGEVRYIHLYENHSGVTLSAVQQGWRIIPVSLAGYMTASLFTVLMFVLHRHNRHRLGIAIITAVAALCLVLFVRNDFGAQWLLGFIGINLVAFLIPVNFVRVAYYLLLSFLMLVESVVAAVTIAALGYMDPGNSGDAANLAEATGIPSLVWGIVFVLFALWCAKQSIGHFFAGAKHSFRNRKGMPL